MGGARRNTAATLIRELVGDTPGSLGPVFTPLRLGDPIERLDDAVDARIGELEERARFQIAVHASEVLDRVEIAMAPERPSTGRSPATLAELSNRWGPPVTEDVSTQMRRSYWVNGDLRAALVEVHVCTLALERCVSVARWIGGAAAVVPAALVGQPAARVRARPGARDASMGVAWNGLGVGTGIGITRAHAYIVDDTIVAVTASVAIAESTRDDIARHIRAHHGPPIELEFNLGTAYMTIGSVPERQR